MRQFIFPLLLVGLAIALFVMYTNPTYQSAKSVLAEVNSYNDALSKSKELRKIRDEKIAAFNTFSPAKIDRLKSILPDNVDNIHLIIDINNIANAPRPYAQKCSPGRDLRQCERTQALAVGSSGEAVGSIGLSFSVPPHTTICSRSSVTLSTAYASWTLKV
jgi:hypothetical protein